jgi:hypothetical protein
MLTVWLLAATIGCLRMDVGLFGREQPDRCSD